MSGRKSRTLSDQELMEVHAQVLYVHDGKGRLEYVNQSDRPSAPHVFLGRTREGHICRYRHDLPEELVDQLETIVSSEPVPDDLYEEPAYSETLNSLLGTHADVGLAYRFPERIRQPQNVVRIGEDNSDLLRTYLPDWMGDAELSQPVVVRTVDGDAVSICCCARQTSRAAEAGLETAKAFRGRGYAGAVVAAWARAVRELGRIPLYSHALENEASRNVARKLGMVLYGVDFKFT